MSTLKRFVIISMFLSFLVLAATGIIKFPEIQRYFLFVYTWLPASKISMLHDWSSVLFIFLILMHLVLKREGLKKAFDFHLNKFIYVLIGIIITVGIINYFGSKKPIQLSGVEVNNYQGEKLGSINDFRENSIKGPQHVDRKSYRLEITGLVTQPAVYTYEDVLKLPPYQKVVTLNCVEGWSVKALWEGILVKDLFKNVTVKPEANTVIFYAADGYSTSFPLAYILQNNIMMAYKLNGIELPAERGFPFQLVAEQKWGYKWIRWITKIELSSDVNYQGFWESRGYNNDGSLNGSKFSQ
jgi:cytochrome b561